jgi:RNA-splicing ligase RtcB|nr:MAG TPA: tRNA-splicing ligase RtcB [Caudoviricetes sp.]
MERVKIFAKTCEEQARKQISRMANCEAYKNRMIRIMPDVHAGKGCTIGTCISIHDKVVPNTVGVDIGCGMLVVYLGKIDIDLDKLDRTINEKIPCGFNVNNDMGIKGRAWFERTRLSIAKSEERDYIGRSIGTLGGGNHFIEVDKDDDDNKYLVIHSGSRNFGVKVCEKWQDIAIKEEKHKKDSRNELIARLKAKHKEKLIQQELRKLPKLTFDEDLAYVSDLLFDGYICDMKMAQEYAWDNRLEIAIVICRNMDWQPVDMFTSVHNYIDTKKMIVRKGACSAEEGERLIIPMNMRDGSLICVGKGNPDWLFSAPHGAGRLMSRKQAFDTLDLEEYRSEMRGIYSPSVCEETIDESPMVYKPMQEIIDCIEPTVEVKKIIKPIYNFKAKSREKH